MTIQEAIDILKIHQQWRLGADIEMLEPKKISEAINVIILQFPQQQISDEEALRLAKEINKQPMTFVPAEISEKYQQYKDWLNEIPEISDEEIEKAAANLANPNADKTDNWIEGAKWYREQLKRNK